MGNLCLVFGAGSIGKSVAGYVFRKLGFEILFVDVNRAVVDDVNMRKSYKIFRSCGDLNPETVDKISAINLSSEAAICTVICSVDYICTAVGVQGLDSVAAVLAKGIKARKAAGVLKPLRILLCENHSEIHSYMLERLKKHLAHEELEGVYLIETSIERMTKPFSRKEYEFDVVAEEHYPVIISRDRVYMDDLYLKNPEYFLPVENIQAYYYRKLYTNNLGHAVLGYMGYLRDYKNIVQSINDPEINTILQGALDEAGKMLIARYGFREYDMVSHLEKLVSRFSNEGLSDEVERVARSPIRKLSRGERLLGPAVLCLENGIYPANIIKTIHFAVRYFNPNDRESIELNRVYKERGMEHILENICGLHRDELLYRELLKTQE